MIGDGADPRLKLLPMMYNPNIYIFFNSSCKFIYIQYPLNIVISGRRFIRDSVINKNRARLVELNYSCKHFYFFFLNNFKYSFSSTAYPYYCWQPHF